MCGIAGIARREPTGVKSWTLARMAGAIRHRGPDGFGFYVGARVGFAHVRLSIIDVAGGAQPLTNEDGQVIITYNGEVYNYLELRTELQAAGHRFRTRSDTEVLVHAYEEWGAAMLPRLNGQFAFAIYDRRAETVFLARDRFGVRPLFFALRDGTLYFGSEAKAIFASGEVAAAPDPLGIDEVFTFWAAQPPRTVFAGVSTLEPGTYACWTRDGMRTSRYYDLAFAPAALEPPGAVDELDALLQRSVALRMRADVPVAGYLSGGLDSTVTCALGAAASPHRLRTFSLTFDDPLLDERGPQAVAASAFGTVHTARHVAPGAIADSFPAVVWHAETPLIRTAAAPLYLLSEHAREHGIKVVLTGEGADEVFLGYDLFKEVAVREFCDRNPASRRRPILFDALYPYLRSRAAGGEFWRQFFRANSGIPGDPLASHLARIRIGRRARDFYSPDLLGHVASHDVVEELRDRVAPKLRTLTPLDRAAYLEFTTLLSPYLLPSQGDRVALAHGVEARFPFLDHTLFEFAARLPSTSKLHGLREKDILRRWAARVIPPQLAARGKQPYRAPDAGAFTAGPMREYVHDLLSERAIRDVGMFAPSAVAGLLRRVHAGAPLGFRENQAFVGMLSHALWHDAFFAHPIVPAHLSLAEADVLIHEPRPAGASLEPLRI